MPSHVLSIRQMERKPQTGESSAAYERPRTRGDCEQMPRPCPWLGCRYHLQADVKDTGALRLLSRHSTLQVLQDSEHTCALDVAAEGPSTLEAIGQTMGVTTERARQLCEDALAKLNASYELTDTPVDLPDTTYSRKPRNAEDETADILGLEAAPWMTSALCHWTTPSE